MRCDVLRVVRWDPGSLVCSRAQERVRLFRLAWDLIGTEFGSRQTLYERFFNGDVVQLRQRRYATYDYTRANASLETFMREVEGR